MNIDEFYSKYKNSENTISSITEKWREKEIDDNLDALLSAGMLTADGLIGDGLSDRITPELLHGLSALKGDVESYGEARTYLRSFLEKNDESIKGMINKIKGQIGENRFIEATDGKAQLANSGNQEGWDIYINHGGSIQYVQVKTYTDPNTVIQKMIELQDKIDLHIIFGAHGEEVSAIDIAIPHDIVDVVREKAANIPALADVHVLPLDITASKAADIVQEGLTNLGSSVLAPLFGKLLASTLSAATIHTLLSSVRVWKGQMAVEEAAAQVLENTAFSAARSAAELTLEVVLDKVFNGFPAPVSISARIAVRTALKKAVKEKFTAYQHLCLNNQILKNRIEHLGCI